MVNIAVRTVAEFEAAVSLIRKCHGAPEGSPEHARMIMLIEAAEAWMRLPGRL